MTDTIVGNIDLAQVALYMFWVFFAGLIYYLQTENMREGFPLETEDGAPSSAMGLMGPPAPKTFKLPHGRGEVSVPNDKGEGREIKLTRPDHSNSYGLPFDPVGDPLVDGVGPASWAARRDEPELDSKGHPKIVPMSKAKGFHVSAGKDPHGLPVVAGDGETVGEISDVWIDEPEQLVRYLEIKLLNRGGRRLVPMGLAKIKSNRVVVHSLHAKHFRGVPKIKTADKVTLLEEEKISAYYCGGKLYASPDRIEAKI